MKTLSPHRLTALSLCLATAFAAHAQTTTPVNLDTVAVTGQLASLRGAQDKQRAAQGVVSVVHADNIGQLPDNNAAEALARLPGVSVERDQGEGRFIRVRGLGPDYNAVTINGALVPAAESDRRAAGLDVVPAGLVRSLEVLKTLSPEHDANSLGGTVSVNTLSAFDQSGRVLRLELGGNYDANAAKSAPSGSVTFADRFNDGTLGLAFALSSDSRRFASDNVETGGGWDGNKLSAFELRRYEITRARLGAALNLDFKPNTASHFYLRGFSSRFTDDESRQSNKISFATASAEGVAGDADAARGLKARQEINRVSSLTAGADHRMGDWRLWAEAGSGRASEDKPDALASSSFKGSFKGVSFVDGMRPVLQAPAALNSAGSYAFDKLKLETSTATDVTQHLKFDLQRSLALAGMEVDIKGGVKVTRRSKDNALETYAIGTKQLAKVPYSLGKPQLAFTAFASGDRVNYPWNEFGPGVDEARLRALIGTVKLADFRDAVDSQVNDFKMNEDVNAAYVQTQIEHGSTQWVLGVRNERISFDASGWASDTAGVNPVAFKSSSDHWLPSVLWRQELSKSTRLRGALTHSVVRPSFGQLAPGVLVDDDTAELGNPELKPLRSRNLDFGVEHDWGREGGVSAYVFHKQINDFAFQTDLAGTAGKWKDFSAVNTFANGDAASLHGVELAYNQSLPGGIILGANASFVRSEATISGFDKGVRKSRQIGLPSQSDRTVNLSVGWEGHGISTRVALNHKSPYLFEVGSIFDASKDLMVDTQNQVDFSLRYQIGKRWQVSFEALNLGNASYYVYQADKARNAQYEQYGRSYKLGLKVAVY
ncbi:MAG: TonB-dependent receptor [Pseudomonadota bacterium]